MKTNPTEPNQTQSEGNPNPNPMAPTCQFRVVKSRLNTAVNKQKKDAKQWQGNTTALPLPSIVKQWPLRSTVKQSVATPLANLLTTSAGAIFVN